MLLIAVSISILLTGGILSLVARSSSRNSNTIGMVACVVAGAVALIPTIRVLIERSTILMHIPWALPSGVSLSIGLDPLSAMFLLPTLIVSGAAAVYGSEYLHGTDPLKTALSWFQFCMLMASMMLVVVARNSVVFLLAWEIMSISSLLLVLFDHQDAAVRRAGWLYFIAGHIGVAFLLLFFLVLETTSGSFEFSSLRPHGISGLKADVLFLFAVCGFGCKAGIVPFHVWLPEAHPAAPSHVSAVMSGVMIKMGIYGILRALTFLDPNLSLWGTSLLLIGMFTGVAGVLLALSQHDIKRLLAYSSVENIGIIVMGIGLGLLGVSSGNGLLALGGFAGALLHVVNHGLFKGLLFLGAGAVAHATGTRRIDELGGLLKKMPVTGTAFLIGSAAICGLPPLNGFISEFAIYMSGFAGIIDSKQTAAFSGMIAVAGLALIGGMAVTCFTKAFGAVFLGECRTPHAVKAHEPGWAMRYPMIFLAASCVLVGLAGPLLLRLTQAVILQVVAVSPELISGPLPVLDRGYIGISIGVVLLAVVVVFMMIVRSALLRRHGTSAELTWDCGYARPTARMQYTGSSFTQPVVHLFRSLLWPSFTRTIQKGYFPETGVLESTVRDPFLDRIFLPAARRLEAFLSKLRRFQGGRIHVYVMYIALAALITLLAVLAR